MILMEINVPVAVIPKPTSIVMVVLVKVMIKTLILPHLRREKKMM